MSKSYQIQCAYEKKMQLFIEARRRMPKEPIRLSLGAAWVCVEDGMHSSNVERVLAEAQNELGESFPRTLSDRAAKMLTRADLDRLFSREAGPGSVILNAIAFQNMSFWDADKENRGSFHAHNQTLAEQFVRMALKYRDHCRRERRRD